METSASARKRVVACLAGAAWDDEPGLPPKKTECAHARHPYNRYRCSLHGALVLLPSWWHLLVAAACLAAGGLTVVHVHAVAYLRAVARLHELGHVCAVTNVRAAKHLCAVGYPYPVL